MSTDSGILFFSLVLAGAFLGTALSIGAEIWSCLRPKRVQWCVCIKPGVYLGYYDDCGEVVMPEKANAAKYPYEEAERVASEMRRRGRYLAMVVSYSG